MMRLNHQLDEKQLAEVQHLIVQCQQKDTGLVAIYPQVLAQERSGDYNALYYQNGTLIGFLSVYFFYEDACEVSMCVAPKYRRQGIATKLLHAMLPAIKARNLKRVIFSTPPSASHAWLAQHHAQYQHTEYHMQRLGLEPILKGQANLSVRKLTKDDISAVCEIDKACFPHSPLDMVERFSQLLHDNQYSIYIACLNHIPIGKAHIRWLPSHAVFSDIAILPSHQGQGLGGELLAFCINEALSQNQSRIELDVETGNDQALHLYTRYGFQVKQQYEFWSIRTEDMAGFIG